MGGAGRALEWVILGGGRAFVLALGRRQFFDIESNRRKSIIGEVSLSTGRAPASGGVSTLGRASKKAKTH